MSVDATALATAMASVQLTPLTGTFYRSVALQVVKALGVPILAGRHAGRTGGRYNASGGPPICYLAGSQTLASLECEQDLLVLRSPPATNPRLVVAVTLANAQVLDLTNNLVLTHLGLDRDELLVPMNQWRNLNAAGSLSVAQQVGEAARRRDDIDGLLAPSWLVAMLKASALPRMENLVLFMSEDDDAVTRRPAVSLEVHDPDGLLDFSTPKPAGG